MNGHGNEIPCNRLLNERALEENGTLNASHRKMNDTNFCKKSSMNSITKILTFFLNTWLFRSNNSYRKMLTIHLFYHSILHMTFEKACNIKCVVRLCARTKNCSY